MPPPLHVTGDPNADWIIFTVGAVVSLYWLRALRLAREGARLFLRNLARAVLAFCISVEGSTVFVPRSVFADLLDPKLASVRFEKGDFVLTITGADGAESYVVHVYFDMTRVKKKDALQLLNA